MPQPGKAKRKYDSSHRREQAASTREKILKTAQGLFQRDGYGGTTMDAIARQAGVAPKTVYLAFEGKSGLLRAIWNLQLRGGQEETPIAEHPWYREVIDEADPERQLRLNARNSRRGKLRIGALAEVIRSAAQTDPDISALWDRINSEYHANQMAIVESIEKKGALRPELNVERATDILWTINHPSTWQLLVGQRDWSADEYEQWCADSACSALLRGDPMPG